MRIHDLPCLVRFATLFAADSPVGLVICFPGTSFPANSRHAYPPSATVELTEIGMKLAEIRLIGGQFARETERPERARTPLFRHTQFGISSVSSNRAASRSQHGGGT